MSLRAVLPLAWGWDRASEVKADWVATASKLPSSRLSDRPCIKKNRGRQPPLTLAFPDLHILPVTHSPMVGGRKRQTKGRGADDCLSEICV